MTKITIELNTDLAQKVERLANSYENKNILFKRFIRNYKSEIEDGINEIEKDLKKFEQKYNMSSILFHEKFKKGEVDDSADFMIWAGIYEMQLDSKNKLVMLRTRL
jgi:hypothetical protein